MIDLEKDGDVFVLHMRDGENRFNDRFLAAFSEALDEVESSIGDAALVTCGEGKFYSNGLDLAWLGGEGEGRGPELLASLDAVFARLLGFPVVTVAALNGHAFAGGGMLAMAHDFRIMRSDRGFFCLPEIDLAMGQPLSDGMYAVLESRLSRNELQQLLITGRRFGGCEAAERGIVDETRPEEEVLPRAIAMAQELAGKDRATMSALKRGLHRSALDVLARH